MSRRPTFTDRRRHLLARKVESLEAMEGRAMITESLGILTLGIGIPAAVAAFRTKAEAAQAAPPRVARPKATFQGLALSRHSRADEVVSSGNAVLPVTASPPAASSHDWLTLFRKPSPRDGADSSPNPAPPAKAAKSSAGGSQSRGGVGIGPTGAVAPLRLAPPAPAAAGSSTATASLGAAATAVAFSVANPPHLATPATQSHAVPLNTATGLAPDALATGVSGAIGTTIHTGSGGGSPLTAGSFPYFPLYTLDYNDGTVLFPGGAQEATLSAPVDLRAQVRDTTVSSYSWNTTGLSTDALGITGASTYRLQFKWTNNSPVVHTDTVSLTVTNSALQVETQTYNFVVPTGSVSGSGGGTGTVWPEALAPNTALPAAPSFPTQNAAVDADSGSLDATIPLPAYNPNLPALALTYDSLNADPRPIVVEHHTIDPTQSIPTQVSGQLTFNGTAGTTYYYNTAQFIPGDVQQIALQANATGLATGRYSYTVTVGDVRGTTTTTTVNGTATVLNGSGSAFGDGWTLQGLERITTASGGVILDLGMADKSLWFTASGGSGGTYTSPGGDFSTLAAVSGGGYTRTLTDGTVYRFNPGGQETSVADRNGLRTTFAYSSGGALSTVTDPYSKVTTFAYSSGGALSTVTDPDGRVATFTHTGSDLTGVTLPDTHTWGYAYDSGGRLTQVTDPNSKTTTVAYDGAERVSTVTQPDGTTETVTAYQERGWTNTGTSGSPAAPTLLAEARGSFTDPNSHTTDLRPDWNGEGLIDEATDPDGNVATFDRDVNGLATVMIDRINRVSLAAYDAHGNATTVTYPDGKIESAVYNGLAEPTSVTDANRHTTTYTYDGDGNLKVVQDPLSDLTTMTYTGDGKLATVEDPRSNTTSYAYDTQDRLTTVTHPDTSTTLIAYDGYGNPNSVTDERGYTTTSSYDALNRLTGTTDALTDRTTYVHDSGGNLTAVQAPPVLSVARTTTYAYDAMDRVTTVTDPLSHATVYGYDSGGNLRTVTDPLSRVTTYAYDAEDRPTAVTDPNSHTTTTTYDAEGQVVNVTDPLSRVTTITYNARGWEATVTDPLGDVTTYGYTPTGKPSTVTSPGTSGGSTESYFYDSDDRLTTYTDALGDTTVYGYDSGGNQTTVTDPLGHVTSYGYDSRDRLTTVTDPLSHVTVYGYDSGGNQTTVTDPNGYTTTSAYDALDRVTTVTDARSGVTTIAFDAAGRQTGLTDPKANRTTWSYDAADRLTTLTTPIGTTTYVYDNANELTDTTDADGRRTTYSYDSGGRQTGETWVAASPSETITYVYDADDELTGADDANATLTFTYDSGGRQLTAATSGTAGQPNVTLTSGYDAFGDRTSRTDNLSSVGRTTYVYDAAFRLTTITTSYGGTNGPQVIFGYDSGGRLTSESRTIGGSGTAVATSFGYDNADRLTTLTHQVTGGSALATYVYGYDSGGRVTSERNAEGTVTYGYDADDELTGASGSRAETYTYDLNGNRTMTGYTIGSDNELTASPGATYTYDAEGNMTAQSNTSTHVVTSFKYDFRNELIGVKVGGTTVATYTYDALGRRIGFDDNGTQTWVVWDGQYTYADFNGSGALQQRYLYGPAVDQILARTGSGGTTAWYLSDRLGTVRDIANSSGVVIDHLSYDSFGSLLSESSQANGDRFKFAARDFDSNVGLYYNRARYYSTTTGRFISQDPISFVSGTSNLYGYTANNSTNYTDPSGEGPMPGPVSVGLTYFLMVMEQQRLEKLQYQKIMILRQLTIANMEKATIDQMLNNLMLAKKEDAFWDSFELKSKGMMEAWYKERAKVGVGEEVAFDVAKYLRMTLNREREDVKKALELRLEAAKNQEKINALERAYYNMPKEAGY